MATKAQLKEIEQHGVIATNQANLPTVALVYGINHFEVDEVFARIGSMMNGEYSSSASNAPLKKYKIRLDKDERPFFANGQGVRFYLDETVRTLHGHGW